MRIDAVPRIPLIGTALREAPAEDREGFLDAALLTLFRRSGVLAVLVATLGFLLIALVDFFGVDPGDLPGGSSSRGLLLRVALVATAWLHLLVVRPRASRPSSPAPGFHRQRAAVAGALSFLLCDVVLVGYLASSGDPGPVVAAIFCCAAASSLPGLPGLVPTAVNVVLSVSLAASSALSGAVLVASSLAAALVSRLEVDSRAREFLAGRALERQAVELAGAKGRLERQGQEYARLDRDRNEFMGMAVHNLQNPLSSIMGYSEILLEGAAVTDREREEILRRVLGASRKMSELIRNILDLNAISRGEVPCSPREVDLAALAGKAVASYEDAARKKAQTIRIEAPEAPVAAWADPAMALQVIENLVSNAVKFSPPGSEITVSVYRGAEAATCRVEDQGPGLTEEDRKRLFGTFARLSARPTGGEPSTGLGLSIVRRLATALSARVHAESRPGGGAAFVLELPVSPDRLVPGP